MYLEIIEEDLPYLLSPVELQRYRDWRAEVREWCEAQGLNYMR